MSVVSGITVICATYEPGFTDVGLALDLRLSDLHDAVGRRGSWFHEVSDHAGGYKHPQCRVYVAGINYLDDADRFAARVLDLQWKYPENLVIVVQPEDGATRVWQAPR